MIKTSLVIIHNHITVDYTTLLKSQAAIDLETALNSSPGPNHHSHLIFESPILSSISGSAGTPGTPVDIKSVPQIRKLSCKKLIYSYTFGSGSGSSSSSDPSPKILKKPAASHGRGHKSGNSIRSPSQNCRQNYNANPAGSANNFDFKNHIEWSSGQMNAPSSLYTPKRKH